MSAYAEFSLLLIVLLPLLGALLNGVVGCFFKAERGVVLTVAVGSVALAFALSVFDLAVLLQAGEDASITHHVYRWFGVAMGPGGSVDVPVNVRLHTDALGGIMAVMVTGVGLCIHIYSIGYMAREPSFARFFAYLNLLMASMLVLVLASNLPLMFAGWQGVGLCSYLLIGFWYENPRFAAAGKKAFIVNRIGDFGVLVGMFLLLQAAGSFEFSEINGRAGSMAADVVVGGGALGASVATVACLFLFFGCTAKSAQIPLFVWLPDAMAGPTPVSALIQAATMVTSGVYLCCRLSPVFVVSPTAMAVIAVVGTSTALVAASIALVQNELKRVLAYSTVSQLGFMFAAIGVGAFGAAIFHVLTHAFFKACLFLGAGSVMHAVHAHGDSQVAKLGGLGKPLPRTCAAFLVSAGALAGFPLSSGFFSQEEILVGALRVGGFFPRAPWLGGVVFAGLGVAALGTAFYIFRLYYLTFSGAYRGPEEPAPHEAPVTMTLPLGVLALGAALSGVLALPHWTGAANLWDQTLHGVLAELPGAASHEADVTTGLWAAGLGTLAWAAGWSLARAKYRNGTWRQPPPPHGLHRWLLDAWRIDAFYRRYLVGPFAQLCTWLGEVDRAAVDGVIRLLALLVRGAGYLVTRAQTGVVRAHAAALVVGLGVVSWWVLYPHAHIDHAVSADAASLLAGEGAGYQYRWDFDSDGEFDTDWASARDASHAYASEDAVGVELVLTHTTALGFGEYSLRLHEGQLRTLQTRYLGPGWLIDTRHPTPPRVSFRQGELSFFPGGSRLRVDGVVATGHRVPVRPGAVVQVGQYAKLRVDVVVRSTLEVRSVFGFVSRASSEFSITPRRGERLSLGTDGPRAGVRGASR